ncbi:MAG: hypothetical protein E7C49_01155 [Clostridium sp.]|nr:hypothetical protein [Clostridium sp.]
MTLNALEDILKNTNYPVKYSHFSKPVTPPYITYIAIRSGNFIADNKVYKKIDNIQIELYTSKKDLEAENTLENLLDENDIAYEYDEAWIESEKLFQRIYEVRLI